MLIYNWGSPDEGLEPATLRLKVWCSTDWANRAHNNNLEKYVSNSLSIKQEECKYQTGKMLT